MRWTIRKRRFHLANPPVSNARDVVRSVGMFRMTVTAIPGLPDAQSQPLGTNLRHSPSSMPRGVVE
jgi:hypothetical protein